MMHDKLHQQLERIAKTLPDRTCRCCGKATTFWASMPDGRPLHTQCMGKHVQHSKGIRKTRCQIGRASCRERV